MNTLRGSVFLMLLAVLSTGVWAGPGAVERSFDVQPGGRLIVDSDLGKIVVRGGSGSTVEVTVRYEQFAEEQLRRALVFEHDPERNEVRVEARLRDRSESWFGWLKEWRRTLEFDVRVPERFDVDLKTAGGSITVDRLQGEARARTSGGGLNFGEIDGPVHGRTSGGSIELSRSSGDADLGTSGGGIRVGETGGSVQARTSGGSIRIERSGGSVEARTSGGGITVEDVLGDIDASTSGGSISARISGQPEGDCKLSTSGGSVEVFLAPGVAVDLDARSSGGRVTNGLDLTERRKSTKQELEGSLNGGGPRLVLRTSGGSIRIKPL